MSVSNLPQNNSILVRASNFDWRGTLKMLVVLMKLRVVFLLLMASVGGAFLGAGGVPNLGQIVWLLVAGTMAAGGAGALNQYIERDKDKQMSRTKSRPLPAGTIDQGWVPMFGVNLIALSVIFTMPFNGAMAFFLLLGAVIYVGVYTLWLKPRTLLNIVIGGAAGSAAVMSGGAAVGAWQNPAVIVLALMLFLWTPAHFWSLAILYKDDYARADVPMLPVKMSERAAAWWVLSHALPTTISALLLTLVPELGWLYFVPVLIASVWMMAKNFVLIATPNKLNARRFFIGSNIYLAVILVAVMVDTVF